MFAAAQPVAAPDVRVPAGALLAAAAEKGPRTETAEAAARPPVGSAPRGRKRTRGGGVGAGGEDEAALSASADVPGAEAAPAARPSRRVKLGASAAVAAAAPMSRRAGSGSRDIGGGGIPGGDGREAPAPGVTCAPGIHDVAGGGGGRRGLGPGAEVQGGRDAETGAACGGVGEPLKGQATGGRGGAAATSALRRRGPMTRGRGESAPEAARPQPPVCISSGVGRETQRVGRKTRRRQVVEAPEAATEAPIEDADAPAAAPLTTRRAKKGGGPAVAKNSNPRLTVLSAVEVEALRGQPLLDLGELVPGSLLRRPSAAIKTPYVADVRLRSPPAEAATSGGGGDGDGGGLAVVLAHAPALDCAGMVAPGATVYLTRSAAGRREGVPRPTATSHAIQLVEDQRPGGSVAIVGAHPQLAERLAAEMIRRRVLEGVLGPYHRVETQRTYGTTRVDFVLHMADGSSTLLEVKNVVCADFPEGGVPPGRPAVGVYTAPLPRGGAADYRPTALFPHGAQKSKIKVVSDRAIKHVWELTQLHTAAAAEAEAAAGEESAGAEAGHAGAGGEGKAPPQPPPRLRCAVLFVVNRSDCAAFRPCHEADPLFAAVLKAAQEAGVRLLSYDVTWSGGRALPGKGLPVVFGAGVSSAVDPARLAEVLTFNANDPRNKSWKKSNAAGTSKAPGDNKKDAKAKKAE